MFIPKYIGSASAPFRIRIENWGASGPTEITGLPAGVHIRSGYTDGVAKYDPAPTFGLSEPFRFLHYHIIPSVYGSRVYTFGISSGCAEGNATSNASGVSSPWLFRAEASRDGNTSQYVTSYFDVRFQNAERWQNADTLAWSADGGGSGQDNAPGDTTPDRTFGHVFRSIAGTTPSIRMLDTNTATGPGAFNSIQISRAAIDQGGYIIPIYNTITDTNVSGVIAIGQDSTGTVVDNVNFTGAAREIVTIGDSATVTMLDICAPANSTVTGTGTLTYEGATQSLPFTLTNEQNCNISATHERPDPPGTN
jgi:hypothetical protein